MNLAEGRPYFNATTVLDSWCGGCHGGGLVAVFEVGGTGVVGHGFAALNPLTALHTHVVGAPRLQLAVLVGVRMRKQVTSRA